jgi:hypothetical protein
MGLKRNPRLRVNQEIIMKNIKIAAAMITTFAITAPTLAFADAAWHPGKGDAVYVPHQGYKDPAKSASHANKGFRSYSANIIGSEASGDGTTHGDWGNSRSGKSRQEVLRELQSQTPEERRLANSN